MKAIETRVIKAAEMYLTRKNFEILDSQWEAEDGSASVDLVAKENDAIVFFDITAQIGYGKGMPAEDTTGSRQRMEFAAAKWLSQAEDVTNKTIRFDFLTMLIFQDDKALIRHHIDALGTDAELSC